MGLGALVVLGTPTVLGISRLSSWQTTIDIQLAQILRHQTLILVQAFSPLRELWNF